LLYFTRKVKPFIVYKNLNNFPLFQKNKKIPDDEVRN